MTKSKLSLNSRVTFQIFEWDYSFNMSGRRIPVTKIGTVIGVNDSKALIRLDDNTEVEKDIEDLNKVPKFAEF